MAIGCFIQQVSLSCQIFLTELGPCCGFPLLRRVQTDGLLIYQPGLVLQHRCTRVPGISLAICVREQDLVDPDFAAPLQVCACVGLQSPSLSALLLLSPHKYAAWTL